MNVYVPKRTWKNIFVIPMMKDPVKRRNTLFVPDGANLKENSPVSNFKLFAFFYLKRTIF